MRVAQHMMKAIVVSDGAVQLDNARAVSPQAAGQAIVRVTLAAISRFDLLESCTARGFSGVPGHEIVGVVEQADGADNRSLIGKRVLISPVIQCGECDMCRSGLRLHCRNRVIIGVEIDGGLCEFVTVPIDNLFLLPDSLDHDHAVFASAVAASLEAQRQSDVEGKRFVTVLGDGPVGMLTGQLLSLRNKSTRVLGTHLEKLALCEKWSVKHRLIGDVGRRADQDVVVDCTGDVRGLADAIDLVRPRGQIVCKSMTGMSDTIPGRLIEMLAEKEVSLIGSGFGPIRDALSLLTRRELDVLNLIGKRLRLDDVAKAIVSVSAHDQLKVLVEV